MRIIKTMLDMKLADISETKRGNILKTKLMSLQHTILTSVPTMYSSLDYTSAFTDPHTANYTR
jgi:hypothetical protein